MLPWFIIIGGIILFILTIIRLGLTRVCISIL